MKPTPQSPDVWESVPTLSEAELWALSDPPLTTADAEYRVAILEEMDRRYPGWEKQRARMRRDFRRFAAWVVAVAVGLMGLSLAAYAFFH